MSEGNNALEADLTFNAQFRGSMEPHIITIATKGDERKAVIRFGKTSGTIRSIRLGELSGLRPAEANWLVEVMLSWVYFYRLYNCHRGERLRHVIIIDEAHHIFDRSKEYRETAQEMGTPIISIFPTQFRDFGTSLILTSQTPSFMMEACAYRAGADKFLRSK